jgi:tRNA (adenine37-N6)-methyltransferase
MVRENQIRESEIAVTIVPPPTDAGLVFIGSIHTPWTSHMETPRQGRTDGPLCRVEVFEPWVAALSGLEQYERVEVLYWLHLSRRDLVLQSPANDGTSRGTFSLRADVVAAGEFVECSALRAASGGLCLLRAGALPHTLRTIEEHVTFDWQVGCHVFQLSAGCPVEPRTARRRVRHRRRRI